MRRERTKKWRSWVMSRIRGKDTGPEMELRRLLREANVRFIANDRSLPGTPDVVISSKRRAVFVHGCFWHSHHCRRGARPKSNARFWNEKLDANRTRDMKNRAALRKAGWTVSVIWQCSLRRDIARLMSALIQARSRLGSRLKHRDKLSRKKAS